MNSKYTAQNIRDYFTRRLYYIIQKSFFGKLGMHSRIVKPFLLYNKKSIFIGEKVFIRNFARIEPIKIWREQVFNPRIIIGDKVSIEQGLHLTCADEVVIGEGCVLSSYCCITDIEHCYDDIHHPVLQQRLIVKKTKIGKNSFLGTGVKIMAGVTLGNNVVVGANSVVTKDIPSYCVAAGIPARIIKKYDFEQNRWEKTSINEKL